jgi:hypothetical protein
VDRASAEYHQGRRRAHHQPVGASQGSRIQLAIARALPEDVATAAVGIPRGAVLSIALALDDGIPRDGLQGVEFVLTGEQSGKRHELLRAVVPRRRSPGTTGAFPLDAFAATSMQFHFATRVIPQPGVDPARVTAVPLWGAPEILAPAANTAPPNVILVSLDTLRADHVGAFGETRGLTPHIDALAAAGTAFENAFTTYPSTAYAHLSMLSGLYPRRIGPVSLNVAVPGQRAHARAASGSRRLGHRAVTEDVVLAAASDFRAASLRITRTSIRARGRSNRGTSRRRWGPRPRLARASRRRSRLPVRAHLRRPLAVQRAAEFQSQRSPIARWPGLKASYAAEVRYADTQIARLVDTLERLGIASRHAFDRHLRPR